MEEKNLNDEFLYSHSLFGGLTVEELGYLRPYFKQRDYHAGEIILHQGEANSTIHFILSGSVDILKSIPGHEQDMRQICTLYEGDTFGEMELIDVQHCAATARAAESCSLVTFTNADLYALSKDHLKTYAMLIMNLAREISRRLRITDEALAEILYHSGS